MKSILFALTATLCLALPLRAEEKSETVALEKLPANVLEAVKKKYPKGTLVKAVKEEEKGEIEYEVLVKEDGKNIEVSVDENGEIESIEKEIDAKELPKSVTKVIEKKYPKATYKLVEACYEVEDGKDEFEYYEIELVTADKKEIEVKIKADGKIVEEEEDDKPSAK